MRIRNKVQTTRWNYCKHPTRTRNRLRIDSLLLQNHIFFHKNFGWGTIWQRHALQRQQHTNPCKNRREHLEPELQLSIRKLRVRIYWNTHTHTRTYIAHPPHNQVHELYKSKPHSWRCIWVSASVFICCPYLCLAFCCWPYGEEDGCSNYFHKVCAHWRRLSISTRFVHQIVMDCITQSNPEWW